MSMASQPLFVVTTRRVVVDANDVGDVAVEIGVALGLEDGVEDAQLGHLLGLERLRVVEDLTITVAENIGGEPAFDPEHPGLEARGEDGLHEGLAGLEVFARYGNAVGPCQLQQRGRVQVEVRGTVGVRDTTLEAGIGIDLAGSNIRI